MPIIKPCDLGDDRVKALLTRHLEGAKPHATSSRTNFRVPRDQRLVADASAARFFAERFEDARIHPGPRSIDAVRHQEAAAHRIALSCSYDDSEMSG